MGKKKFVDDESDEVFQSKKGQMGVDDMVMLPKINEGEIVSNLKKRYDGGSIYTNIGPVLLSVNPYRDLGITGQDYILMYQHKQRHENPPHIYALAEETYRTMRSERENQCCIISGESGAGKTVAAKHIMQYVAAVSGKDPKIEYVKSVILDSNPLLEAFGNAKTLRNDNSSRFGKYFEIQFDGKSDPCGGHITVYLLEKSRVIGPGKDQRNFHFFYQFLAGASQDVAQYYQLYSADNFYYLNQSGCYTVDTIDDVKDYAEVLEAMNVLGFDQTEQGNVHGIVAAILHLGNVAFHDNGKGGADVSYPEVLQLAATYFQVDPSVLNKALTFRVLNTGGGGGGRRSTYNVPQNPEQAGGARDALARDIYSKMFEWLVTKVNTALNKYKLQSSSLIAILDIYGFEIFEDNSFEQFCINYVNEKLQQYFIELTLKAEQDEYQAEGIQWQPIPFFNNQVVCDLIEGKRPPGIFLLLDDVCATVHAESGSKTDYKFLEKIGGSHGNNPHYRAYSGAFGVKHYAGDVVYNVVSFCDKNKDTLFADIIEVMQCSQNPFIVSLFPEQTKNTGGQKKRPTTAGFKIKTSCNKLMAELSKCTPHYVRCLKPNDLKKANNWNAARVKHQCKYLGLLENVKVRRAGFAYRAPYDRFLRRYKKLSSKTWGVGHEWTGAPKDGCLAIVGDLRLDNTQYQCGRTKMFIRHPETVFHLEEQLERLDFECCVSIQKAWRAYTAVKHALEMQAMASDMFKNKKERQRTSQNRTYDGDYGNFDNDFGVQQCFQQYKDEEILFYDTVKKVNRRGKQEDRQFVITEDAYYIIAKAIEKKQVFYKIMRRVKISELQSMSLSTLADNFFVLHSPGSYDNLLWNDHKTEIAIILWEQYKAAMNRDLPINFNNQFQYKLKTGKMAKVTFKKDEKAQPPGVCKGSGLGGGSITITIASGLPSSTDTTPQGYVRGAKRGGGGAGRGGGGGGFGAPQQQQQPMMQQQQAQPMMQQQQQQQPMGGGMRGGGGARGGRGGGGRGRGGGGRGGGGGAPQGPRCRALYAYQGTTPDELTFNEGDIMLIKTEDQGGWMECELQGRRGWAPSNYVQKI